MYAETDYKKVVAKAKELGIATKNMKKEALIEAINTQLAATAKSEKRGRPVDPTSKRQIRLSQVQTGKRGRPADPNSKWNQRQAELQAKREAGTLKLGRAVNPESARQKRLALKGTLPLGRPKTVKAEEIQTPAPAVAETQS